MKELKFRAWIDGEMVYFNLHQIESTETDTFICGRKYFDSDPVMQFTGFKDRNGREIYEGDIVEYVELRCSDMPFKYVVEPNPTDPHLWLKDEGYGYEGEELVFPDCIVVTGNIYEGG